MIDKSISVTYCMFTITRFRCIEVLFLISSLLLVGPSKSFVIPRTSFYRGSLNRDFIVVINWRRMFAIFALALGNGMMGFFR